jgi:hypothetical protein
MAASLGISERRAHGIVSDLAEAGYVLRHKDGRRNRYQIQAHLPVPGLGTGEPAIGEMVAFFAAQSRFVAEPALASAPDARGIRPAQAP